MPHWHLSKCITWRGPPCGLGCKQDGGEILSDVAVLDLESLSWSQAQLQVSPRALFAMSPNVYVYMADNLNNLWLAVACFTIRGLALLLKDSCVSASAVSSWSYANVALSSTFSVGTYEEGFRAVYLRAVLLRRRRRASLCNRPPALRPRLSVETSGCTPIAARTRYCVSPREAA